MQTRIEYIEEYIVDTADNPDGYNPPSFKWNDNHGELVRCKNCKSYLERTTLGIMAVDCINPNGLETIDETTYCSYGEKKEV